MNPFSRNTGTGHKKADHRNLLKTLALFLSCFFICTNIHSQTFYNRIVLKDIKPPVKNKRESISAINSKTARAVLPEKYADEKKNKSTDGIIKCYFDDAIAADAAGPFSYLLTLTVKWTTLADTVAENVTIPLRQSEDLIENGQYLYFHGVTSVSAIPVALTDSASGDTVSFSTLPPNTVLETELVNKSFVPCPNISPGDYHLLAKYISTGSYISITWSSQTCAGYYELEWVYVDDYAEAPNTYKPATALKYYFPHKAMRVRVNHNYYYLPGVFRHGYVIFRVRAVQVDDNGNIIPSAWSLGDNYDYNKRRGINSIQGVSVNYKVYFDNSKEHEPSKNYFFEMFNDETGQRYFNISYYDGQLLNRQNIDFFDTDSIHLVQQPLYDPVWRPVIQTLSAPLYNKIDMKYVPLLCKNTAGQEYQVSAWADTSSGGACASSVIPGIMNITSGPAKYFSPSNEFIPQWQSTNDAGLYTPDAKGYPFTTSLYTNEPDNRVRQAGGPGPYTQPGSGHSTLFFYGIPTQVEIDRLLGNNAGRNTYYRKTAKQDPNGTVTEEISNLAGQIVISSLTYHGDNLLPVDTSVVMLTEPLIDITDGIFANGDTIERDDVFSTTLIQSGNAEIRYDLNIPVFQDTCKPDCYDCVYNWRMFIRNSCGENILEDTSLIAGLNSSQQPDTFCGNAVNHVQFDINKNLSLNEYTYYRQLMLDSSMAENYFGLWIKNNPCLPDWEDFFEEPDTTACDLDCSVIEDSTLVYLACENGEPSFCSTFTDMMLFDVSPSGQYAGYEYSSNGAYTFPDKLSLFRPYNRLLIRHFTGPAIDMAMPLSRFPQYYDGANWHGYYIDENGWCDTLFYSTDSTYVKSLLKDTLQFWLEPATNRLYTYPQYLKTNRFIQWFKPSWAKSLLVYHPEFWYYYYCLNDLENPHAVVSGENMNTFDFDNWLRKNADSLFSSANLVCSITDYDPLFINTYGNTLMSQGWNGRFKWKQDDDCASCYPGMSAKQYFNDLLNNYSGNLSLWETAYIMSQCDASYPLPSSCAAFTDTVAGEYFFNIYITEKQKLLMRYLHIKANEHRGYNMIIGEDYSALGRIWMPFPCDYNNIQTTPGSMVYAGLYPSGSTLQLSNVWRVIYYRYKKKRWGLVSDISGLANATPMDFGGLMQSMGYPPSFQTDPTILSNIYNAQVTQFQYTGHCPAAADLSQLLHLLHLQGDLADTIDLGACSYPGLALFTLTGSQSPVWQPSVSGKNLTAYLYPDNRAIYLTIDTPAFLIWNYHDILALQNLVITGVSGGETNFKMSLWYMASDSSVHRTLVTGHTQLPVQDCDFPPACSYTSYAGELFVLLAQAGLLGDIPSNTTPFELPQGISALLDAPSASMHITTSPNYTISFSANSHDLDIVFDHPLPNDTIAFYDMHFIEADTAGCTSGLMLNYYYNNGTQDSVTIYATADGETLPIYCCSEPQEDPCSTEMTENSDALLQFINNILDNNIIVPQPLTQYIHNNAYLQNYQNSNGQIDFEIVSYLTLGKRDTCYFHLNGSDTCLMQNIISASELIPLATYNNSTGQTYHFNLVYTASNSCNPNSALVTDTLEGFTSCIPLVACPCDEPPCLSFDFPPIIIPPETGPSPCVQSLYANATYAADDLYDNYLDSLHEVFLASYFDACSKVDESFTVRFPLYGEYHTLYEYDDNGNLLRTIPPGGVHPLDSIQVVLAGKYRNGQQVNPVYPNHGLPSNYRYNSQNQVTQQESPDAGLTCLYYDKALRNAASQNAKQRQQNRFSYIKYDAIGRPLESGTGVKNIVLPLTSAMMSETNHPDNWLGNKKEILKTLYDTRWQPVSGIFHQKQLRNRVSAIFRDDDGNNDYEHAQMYSYDAAGNVCDLLHDIPLLDPYLCNRYKTIHYEFDIITGKIASFIYQAGKPDQWHTRYTYNSDNKIKEVFTSRNGVIWERDARYEYYLHQPMKRTIIGESQVQGMDYVYTIEGWIKGVNGMKMNPANDAGMDGTNGPNAFVAKDVLAYWLYYHQDDYKAVVNLQMPFTYTNFVPLYNGNIAATMISQDSLTPLARAYRYDGLSRLRRQDATLNHNGAFAPTQSWQTSYTYDLMGNITTLGRNAINQQPMDRFGYNYYPNTNRLAWVSDSVPAHDFSQDIDNQQSGNYKYDPTGNLIQDNQSEIFVNWTDYGKVKDIRYLSGNINVPPNLQPLKLNFTYDAGANRLTKTFYELNGQTSTAQYTDIYIRDPQGNPVATYQIRNDSLFLDELYIYGTQRLGVLKEMQFLAKKIVKLPHGLGILPSLNSIPGTPPPQPSPQPLIQYKKRYELTDWLGNVRVVITNKKIPLQGSPLAFRPDVVGVTDYYPFGSEVKERTYERQEYRYGFGTQEKDNEITGSSGTHYTAMFWEYDTRLGRRWNVDPEPSSYQSSYSCFINNPIVFSDVNGDTTRLYNRRGKFMEQINDNGEWRYVKVNQQRYYAYKNAQWASERKAGNNLYASLNEGEYATSFLNKFKLQETNYAIDNGLKKTNFWDVGKIKVSFTGEMAQTSELLGYNPRQRHTEDYATGTVNVTMNYSNNSSINLMSLSARSGPWDNGPIPNGDYEIYGRESTNQRGMVFNRGQSDSYGFKVFVTSHLTLNRGSMWFHFDEGDNGTAGCTGFTNVTRNDLVNFDKTIERMVRAQGNIPYNVNINGNPQYQNGGTSTSGE